MGNKKSKSKGKYSLQSTTSTEFSGGVSATTTKYVAHQEYLETYTCIWLDKDVNETDDNKQTQRKLREVIK
jgi:hypothetical protein